MNKVLKYGIIAGLLIAVLVLAGGCFAPAATTNPDGTAREATWFDKYGMILFLVVIFALFYFVMIRPQRKRQKDQQAAMAAMQKGDRVITIGGIYGTIDSLNDDSVVIKTEGGTMLRVARSAVNVRREDTEIKTR